MSAPAPSRRSDAEAIWAALAQIEDPEIPGLSVVDLGIVREVAAGDPVRVAVTTTYAGCPATEVIETAIRQALARFGAVALERRLSPPWTTDWITNEGRAKLAGQGIAPPPAVSDKRALLGQEAAVPCPRCGATETELVSAFGSTPCKALRRCPACLEPFEAFKCF